MSDPICRVQNPYPNNVVKLVHNLPHSEMSNDAFKEYMKSCEYGYDRFFKTYYQLACQLGLYYIDAENNYHPRFLNNINEEQAKIYLINWFSKYYVPNPYTKGFEQLKNPILVEETLYEYIKNYGNSKQILEICKEVFKEDIGNPDIFINAINSYSRKIKISNNKFEIKDFKEVSMETGNNRDDKKAFFDTFSKDNGTDKLPFPRNRIIFGAPGTGKSHKLNDESSLFGTNKERVTFHPNYSYAQFVGTYKPVKKINTDTRKEEISYEYVPGPFMRTFVKAYFDSKKYISNCNALIEDAKKEDTNVKYYIAPCNISDWNYFEKINHINQIESWRNPPNGIKEGDVIFIYIGTTGLREFNDSRKPGVYAIATAVSEPYEASGVRARVDLKFIDIALKNPLYTEDEIKEKNPNNRIQNFQEFSFGKNLLRDNDSTLKKFKPLNFLLLIEEINRANVAAVFGDVFQLLDRDENGNSEYPIAASEDIKKYLAKNGIHEDELKIPSNMYIWATMNSADQGVFPMDTAFKRRWEFEYIGIDENEDKVKNYEIPISATKKVYWNDLRKAINNKLITLGINEDKLLGPFFLSKTVLDSALDKGMDFVKLFEGKVLMYLFEDAAKMKAKQLFNVDEKKFIYSEVCKKFEEIGVKVFKFNDEDVVEEHDISSKEDAVPTEGKLF